MTKKFKRSSYKVQTITLEQKKKMVNKALAAFATSGPKNEKETFMIYLSLAQDDISEIAAHYCTKYGAWGPDLHGDFIQVINLSLMNCVNGYDRSGRKAISRYKKMNRYSDIPFSLLGYMKNTTTKTIIAEVSKYKGHSVSLATVSDERDRRQDYDTILGSRIKESFSELHSYEKSAMQAYLDDRDSGRPTKEKLLVDVASGIFKINKYIGYSKMSLLDNLPTFQQASDSHMDSLPELRQGRHKGDISDKQAHSHKGIVAIYPMLVKAGTECLPN